MGLMALLGCAGSGDARMAAQPAKVECPKCPACLACPAAERVVIVRPRPTALRHFGECMTGPGRIYSDRKSYIPCDWLVDCIAELDADADQDIDLADWARWTR